MKRKTGTLECKEKGQILKISHHKNVNKGKNHCTPVKLESKKNDKKIIDPGRDRVGKFPAIVKEEATSHLVY